MRWLPGLAAIVVLSGTSPLAAQETLSAEQPVGPGYRMAQVESCRTWLISPQASRPTALVRVPATRMATPLTDRPVAKFNPPSPVRNVQAVEVLHVTNRPLVPAVHATAVPLPAGLPVPEAAPIEKPSIKKRAIPHGVTSWRPWGEWQPD